MEWLSFIAVLNDSPMQNPQIPRESGDLKQLVNNLYEIANDFTTV
jgi:hypothetical protein